MRTFVHDILRFGAIQAVILAVILALYPGGASTYYAATVDKHHSAETTPPPRILFVGGSSTAFGVDSPMVRDATGLEPVNMGLHVGFGLDFILNEASDTARRGDLIVLIPEYDLFLHDTASGVTLLRMIETRPANALYMSLHDVKHILDAGLPHLKSLARQALRFPRKTKRASPGYAREDFNAFGDVIGHHGAGSRLKGDSAAESLPPLDDYATKRRIDQITAFAREVRDKGVNVMIFLPAVPPGLPERDARFARLYQMMEERTDIPILNHPREMIYDTSLFYDTGYHLTLEGKRKRTNLLIERLLPRIGRGDARTQVGDAAGQ